MKPRFGKILALVAIVCILFIGIVPANADCTLACCGQTDSQGLYTGSGANGQSIVPGCTANLEDICYFPSDLAFEVRQSAILSLHSGKNSSGINLVNAGATAFMPVYSHTHFVSPLGLLAQALNVPLYLRNLSLLI